MAGFSFQETMRGTWSPLGQEHFLRPIQFDCVAAAGSVWRYLQDGHMQLQGNIRVEGLAGFVPCRGSLEVLLPLQKRLRYDLSFLGDDQKSYRLVAEKHVRYTSPLRTMTFLKGQIFNETGQPVGLCELTFDLRDLPAMVKSYLLSIRAGRPLLEQTNP